MPPEVKILEILELVKGDLICALNLEKIKRNNPHIKDVNFVYFNYQSEDDYMETINQLDRHADGINELITHWEDTRQIIEELKN